MRASLSLSIIITINNYSAWSTRVCLMAVHAIEAQRRGLNGLYFVSSCRPHFNYFQFQLMTQCNFQQFYLRTVWKFEHARDRALRSGAFFSAEHTQNKYNMPPIYSVSDPSTKEQLDWCYNLWKVLIVSINSILISLIP